MTTHPSTNSGDDASRRRRAAVLLSSLPQSQQTAILKKLPVDAAQKLTQSITALGEIPDTEKRRALNAFRHQVDDDSLERNLESQPETRIDAAHDTGTTPSFNHQGDIKETISVPFILETQTDFGNEVQGGFEFLSRVPVKLTASALELEDPQTVAIVLSHLSADLAADLLTCFDLDWRMAILRRLAKPIETNTTNETEIRIRLQQRLDLTAATDGTKGGLFSIVQLLGKLEKTVRQTLIDCLTVNDLSLARKLSEQCIEFDDIAKMKDHEIKSLLKNLDTSLLAPAFSRCKHLTRHKLLKNLAQDAREIVKNDIQDYLPKTQREVESAQQAILLKIFLIKNEGALYHPLSESGGPITSQAA